MMVHGQGFTIIMCMCVCHVHDHAHVLGIFMPRCHVQVLGIFVIACFVLPEESYDDRMKRLRDLRRVRL